MIREGPKRIMPTPKAYYIGKQSKLLRLIVHQHMQFAQKKYVASNLLVIKRKLIHIRQFAP